MKKENLAHSGLKGMVGRTPLVYNELIKDQEVNKKVIIDTFAFSGDKKKT